MWFADWDTKVRDLNRLLKQSENDLNYNRVY